MTVYFVTRHIGALQWACEHNAHYDVHLTHVDDLTLFKAKDMVIGTLPIQWVADLNAQGVHYMHLSMDIPAHLRGVELNAQQLCDCHIRLEAFQVTRSKMEVADNESRLHIYT